MISYGRQDINQDDIDAVVDVLRSEFLTQGPVGPHFEQAVAHKVGAKHAVVVNSATSALHIACIALGLGAGDCFWTVPNTFVASANCGRYCGAEVDFVDIDGSTGNMSVPLLKQKLVQAKMAGRIPKLVIPVHFAGQPTDQEAIWELAQEYGFKVLEDASHAIGAARNGEPVGSCRWSHITVFSFHPVKIVTTGEGGMALTNDLELGERMSMLRSHGITRDAARLVGPDRSEPSYYEQQMLGYNYRMTDIQAALGLSQLKRLDYYIERRNALAKIYDEALQGLPMQLPMVQKGNLSAFHLYVVRLLGTGPVATQRHRDVFVKLREMGIGVTLHYRPVHLQPYYRELGFAPGQFPAAEAHAQSALTLPLYATLSNGDQQMVVDRLRTVVG